MSGNDSFSSDQESSQNSETAYNSDSDSDSSFKIPEEDSESSSWSEMSEVIGSGAFMNDTNLKSESVKSEQIALSDTSKKNCPSEMYLDSSEMSTFDPQDPDNSLDSISTSLDSVLTEDIFPMARIAAGSDDRGSCSFEERVGDYRPGVYRPSESGSSHGSRSRASISGETNLDDYDLGTPMTRKKGVVEKVKLEECFRNSPKVACTKTCFQNPHATRSRPDGLLTARRDEEPAIGDLTTAQSECSSRRSLSRGSSRSRRSSLFICNCNKKNCRSRRCRSKSSSKRSANRNLKRSRSFKLIKCDCKKKNCCSSGPSRKKSQERKSLQTDHVMVEVTVDQVKSLYTQTIGLKDSDKIKVIVKKENVEETTLVVSKSPSSSRRQKRGKSPGRKPDLANIVTRTSSIFQKRHLVHD